MKKGLKKIIAGTMSDRLAKILLNYRISPQTTTGTSPAELLLGRRPRTRLDLVRPNAAERVEEKQQQQKAQHDRKAKPRTFRLGDTVFVKNFGAGQRWLPGQIVDVSGPVSFHVLLEDGRRKRCHQDQLRSRVVDDGDPDTTQGGPDSSFPIASPSSSEEAPTPQGAGPPESRQPTDSSTSTESNTSSPTESSTPVQPTETAAKRYPRRQRRPREWFEPGPG